MEWSEGRLRNIIENLRRHGGDTETIEVKKAAGGVPGNLPETLCAFANMPDGGTVILGVDEGADFAMTGVEDAAAVEAAVLSQARNLIKPAPWLSTQTVTADGVDVVVCEVQGLLTSEKPARYKGKAYLRQADGDYVMNDNDLHILEVAKLNVNDRAHYDQTPISASSVSDLEDDFLQEYISNCRRSSRRLAQIHDDAEILRLTRVITSDGELTLAGLYALGKYPQGAEPGLRVTAAVRLPDDGTRQRTRNLTRFDGPLPVLLQDIMDWVEQNLSTVRGYVDSGHMQDRTELPLVAIRELVANALVHRDLGPDTLGAGKTVDIRITEKALIIVSPGGLRGLSVKQLESSELTRVEVNPRLYYIATQLRTPDGYPIIEGEGGGIREAIKSMQEFGLEVPDFADNGVRFQAMLWRGTPVVNVASTGAVGVEKHTDKQLNVHPELVGLGRNVPAVYEAIRTVGSAGISAIIAETGLSEGQVRYALKALLAHGEVVMRGAQGRRDTTYEVRS